MYRRNNFTSFAVFFCLFVALLAINKYVLKNSIQNTAYALSHSIGGWITSYALTASNTTRSLLHIRELSQENQDSRLRISELESEVISAKVIERENAQLRAQLKLATRVKLSLVTANIFDIERSPLGSHIVINKGSSEGLQKDMPVITNGNILLGRIDEVFSHSAKVLLLDDPHSSVNVRIQENDTLASLHGTFAQGPGTAAIDLVTNKDTIAEGNTIVTSGLDNLPEGLLIGKIQDVTLTGGNIFKFVKAQCAFDPLTSPMVFVIISQ